MFMRENAIQGRGHFIGSAELEVTRIGKECRTRCAIDARVGDCVMPREGIFVCVLRVGLIRVCDAITLTRSGNP